MKPINVKRTNVTLLPDRARVLIRPFNPTSEQRAIKICARVMALSEEDTNRLLEQTLAEFGNRHLKIREYLKSRYEQVRDFLPSDEKISEERSLLLGAYFTHEYSLEAAALFNPSMVPHPDQSDVP